MFIIYGLKLCRLMPGYLFIYVMSFRCAFITQCTYQIYYEFQILAKGLQACECCGEPLHLADISQEFREGLASLLYIYLVHRNLEYLMIT